MLKVYNKILPYVGNAACLDTERTETANSQNGMATLKLIHVSWTKERSKYLYTDDSRQDIKTVPSDESNEMYSSSSMSNEPKKKYREKLMIIIIFISNKKGGNSTISSLSCTMLSIK